MCSIPEFYREQLIVALKPHKCCETGRTIQPGERYWRIVSKWEGVLYTYAQSEGAYHFARWLNGVGDGDRAGDMGKYDGEVCIAFGSISSELPDDEDIREEWRRVCRGEITRNTTKAEDAVGGGK